MLFFALSLQDENAIVRKIKPTWVHLNQLLERYPSTVDEIEATILALRLLYPWVPGPHINCPDGPLPTEKPFFVLKSHFTNDPENFQMAVDNITKTGRKLSASDEEYLRHILCFRSGWSATVTPHHDD